jgi:hypothetical protein
MDRAFYAALRRAVERKEEKHWRWVAALAGAGVPLISTWHDWRPNLGERCGLAVSGESPPRQVIRLSRLGYCGPSLAAPLTFARLVRD